jgi:DUF971 family protein
MIPTSIRKQGDAQMTLTWADGHINTFTAFFLRENCPCASCRHELTGERLLRVEDIPQDIRILSSEILGNYALGFKFSDGHSTGIYTFAYLKKISPNNPSAN